MLSHFSHIRLCDPVDCSPSGYSVHGILQVRTLEWIAMLSPGGSSRPRDQTCISYVSCVAGNFFTASTTWEVQIIGSIQFGSVTQLCPTLCDPMNGSMPGLPVHHQLSEFIWYRCNKNRSSEVNTYDTQVFLSHTRYTHIYTTHTHTIYTQALRTHTSCSFQIKLKIPAVWNYSQWWLKRTFPTEIRDGPSSLLNRGLHCGCQDAAMTLEKQSKRCTVGSFKPSFV